MPIIVNEGGILHTLDKVPVNESSIVYDLDSVKSNEGGVLYEIHSGKKSLSGEMSISALQMPTVSSINSYNHVLYYQKSKSIPSGVDAINPIRAYNNEGIALIFPNQDKYASYQKYNKIRFRALVANFYASYTSPAQGVYLYSGAGLNFSVYACSSYELLYTYLGSETTVERDDPNYTAYRWKYNALYHHKGQSFSFSNATNFSNSSGGVGAYVYTTVDVDLDLTALPSTAYPPVIALELGKTTYELHTHIIVQEVTFHN